MRANNSKEQAKLKLNYVIKKEKERIEKELEDGKQEQTNPVIKLASNQNDPDYLKRFAEEKSRLVIVFDSKSQLKTLCFQPNQRKSNRLQNLETCNFKSDPIQEGDYNDDEYNFKKIDREVRTRFENTSTFPYSVHGLVRVDRGNGSYRTGTGILIGPDLVLTAAHNICDYEETKQKYASIEFIPGINEEETPFGIFKVVESYVPDEFPKTWEKEDYALLILEGAPGNLAGYFGLHVAEQEIIKEKNKELHIIGYPGYVRTKDERNKLKFLSKKGRHQLWGMKGEGWLEVDKENGEFLINYANILTTGGQSGSGVFYHDKVTGEYYVIGVHILGRGGEGGYNSGTWITNSRFSQIEKWISQARKNLIARILAQNSQDGKVTIKNLNLKSLFIGDAGMEALSEFLLPEIESLDLQENHISEIGVQVLSEKTSFKKLNVLNLSSNNIGDTGATELSKNTSWKNLTTLDLWRNNIGGEGATELSKNTSWKNLTTLDLSYNNIGAEGKTAIQKRWPKLKLYY